MHIKTALASVVFLFCWNLTYATNIKGVVRDEQGLPLFHVAIFVPGTNLGTHTNEKGHQIYYEKEIKPRIQKLI